MPSSLKDQQPPLTVSEQIENLKSFIREFEKITEEYRRSVNPNVAAIVIHPDLNKRMNILKNYL